MSHESSMNHHQLKEHSYMYVLCMPLEYVRTTLLDSKFLLYFVICCIKRGVMFVIVSPTLYKTRKIELNGPRNTRDENA